MIHKKALGQSTLWMLGIGVMVFAVLFVLMSKGAFSKEMTSTTAPIPGCKSQNIPVTIRGVVYTKDVAFWGVIAVPDKIEISQVSSGSNSLRAYTTQSFTWSVKLYDDFTGNVVAQDGGNNKHPGGSVLVEDTFVLNFFVPDVNCDTQIDNFEGNLVFNVRTDDGEEKQIHKKISFVGGRYVR